MTDRPATTRRTFLGGALAVGSLLALPRWARAEEAAGGRPRRTLVLLHLNGGNDGLNTVIPHGDPRYLTLRPSLAIPRDQVRRVDTKLGFHPALQGFENLWRRDRLAVVNGVGYPDPDYSHFRATEIWFTAEPRRSPDHGWVGRALDADDRQAPLRAVALLKQKPLSLAAAGPGAVNLTEFGRFRVPAGMEGADALYQRYAELDGRRGQVGEAGAAALEVARRIARLRPADGPFYGRLGRELRKVLALLEADLDLEVIQLEMGGYDTHANQAARHRRLLAELGNNLERFQAALEQRKLADRTVTLVFSEFGRRAKENVSGGTDHGAAGPVFVLGTGLAPGFHGAQPSLEDLDRDNLRFTTDFRRVYASLLRDALGTDPRPVLGDHEPLELFA